MQIAQLSRQLTEVTQQHEAVGRLYEAESAVAAQCADMVEKTNQSNSQLEERISEACALQAAAEQQRDTMEQQLQQAQVPPAGTYLDTLAEGQLLGQLYAVQAVVTFLLDNGSCLALSLINLMSQLDCCMCTDPTTGGRSSCKLMKLQARFDVWSLESCHHLSRAAIIISSQCPYHRK